MQRTCLSASRIRTTPAATTLLFVVVLAGCRVGPHYKPPTAALQPFHNAPDIAFRSTVDPAPPLDVWWEGFKDPTLDRIVRKAIAQNLDLAASLARVEQARAAARGAGAQLLPSGNLTAQTTTLHQSPESEFGRAAKLVPGYRQNQNYYDLGLSASWEVDLFGGLRAGAEVANDQAQAAEAQRLGTRVSVAADAADAYFQIRGAQVRISLAQEQVKIDQHLLQLVQQRRSAGIASEREVAQAEALLSQAEATLPLLAIIKESQANRLDVLLGAQPGTYAHEFDTPAKAPQIPGISGFESPTDFLRRRPDVIAAERQVAASNARIGQALAEYYPKLSLSGVLGSESIAPGHLFTSDGFQPVGVAGLRWRLFDFGRVDAEVKQARGANAEALIKYRSVVLHAAEDVENSFATLAQLEFRNAQVSREISSLQHVRKLSDQSFKAGVIPLTDVLDADRQLLAAKDDLASNEFNAARAAVGSFRALGGGWSR